MTVENVLDSNKVRKKSRSQTFSVSILIGPATLIVLAGLLIPGLILFRYSLEHYSPNGLIDAVLSGENYIKFIADPYYRTVLFRTLRVALWCTIACLIVGFPLAFVLARTRSRFKNLLILLIVLPLFVGNAVRAAGWMTLLGNKGMLNSILMSLGVIVQPLEMMYSEGAVVAGLISINLPFMVLTLQSVLESIDRSIDEAALSLGAGPWKTFWRVIWPLSLPGIVTGTIMVFIMAMNAYATPVLLGGPQFKTMAPLVYDQFQLGNWPFGAAASFILMATTMVLTALASYWLQRRYRQ
ncbi:ABC transporter permease [Pantoea sp. B65]|uniref:ABC transporter permease n=1 Tax=Pantoea sp. B65 TaxID=2813359 RepID=UPI0039B68AAB